MNLIDKAYVMLPDFMYLSKSNLEYLDTLTYITIRSYLNKEMDYSFPSLSVMAKRSGLGTTFLNKSIKRLEAAGYIHVDHSTTKGTCNRYYFSPLTHYERVPYTLFDTSDLTGCEKAILLCLRHHFNHGLLCCIFDLKKLANYIGIRHDALRKQYKSLLKKEYLSEKCIITRNNAKAYIVRYMTDKIGWTSAYNIKTTKVTYAPLLVA